MNLIINITLKHFTLKMTHLEIKVTPQTNANNQRILSLHCDYSEWMSCSFCYAYPTQRISTDTQSHILFLQQSYCDVMKRSSSMMYIAFLNSVVEFFIKHEVNAAWLKNWQWQDRIFWLMWWYSPSQILGPTRLCRNIKGHRQSYIYIGTETGISAKCLH